MALGITNTGNDAVPDELVVKMTGAKLPKVPSVPHLPAVQKLNVVEQK